MGDINITSTNRRKNSRIELASVPTERCDEPLADEKLAQQAAQGCSESFERLVARFQVPLLQFLRYRTACIQDAEDLVQETFVRAYQNLHRYRTSWRFSTWLFTIARRLNINHAARKRATGSLTLAACVPSDTPEPACQLAEQEERQQLWDRAAAELKPRQFDTMWLFYVEELPVKDIARALGCSRVAIRTSLFRARRKLRSVFQEQPSPHRPSTENPEPRESVSGQPTTEMSHV